jgi:DNA helicase-2/ATP-dependent DNA helicase PcrA
LEEEARRLGRAEEVDGLGAKVKGAILKFHALIRGLSEAKDQVPAHRLAEAVLGRTGYLEAVREEEGAVEAETRVENVRELLSAMEEFAERAEEPTLDAFLREVALVSDVDQWDQRTDAVTLMTLHSAKGLEFPTVFIAGLEDGLFPISRMAENPEELEEERRLFYVGITRAKERLFLSYAMGRRRYGSSGESHPSRFLGEVPERLIERRTPGMFEESGPSIRPFGATRDGRVTASPSSSRRLRIEGQKADGRRQKVAGAFDFEDALPFNVGHWIIHPTWGRGQIKEKDGVGPEAKLTIRFDAGTTKKILVKYASLEPA